MKKILTIGAVVATFGLSACGSFNAIDKNGEIKGQTKWHAVSQNYDNSNTTISHQGKEDGAWANSSTFKNINSVEKGMNKEQVIRLIGSPHYSEGIWNVREWNYLWNYYKDNQSTNPNHEHCQQKITFDSKKNVSQVMFKPEGCNIQVEPTSQPQIVEKVIVREVIQTDKPIRQ